MPEPSQLPIESSRKDIDGLFAFAVLAVIAFDFKAQWLRGGFTGIDLVLVIAGFLSCDRIVQGLRQGSFKLMVFYARAFRQIVTPLSIVVLFNLALGFAVLSPWETYRLGQGVVASAVGGANFLYLVRGSFFAERAITNPLLMTWIISLLMQLIFALPLLLFLLRNKGRRTILLILTILCTLSLCASIYLEFTQHVWNFYLPITRAWEFCAGSILALCGPEEVRFGPANDRLQQARGTCGIVLLMVCFVQYRPEMRFPGVEALPPVIGTLLIISSPRSWIGRIFSSRPLHALGVISYSLYLWHWPLLSFAEIASARPLHAVTLAIVLISTLVLALASHFFVEGLLLRRSLESPGRTLAVYAGWMIVLAAAGGVLYVTKGLPRRSPVLYGIESRAAFYRHYPCISSGSYLRLSSQCTPPQIAAEPAMAILGGGHAEAFSEGLRDYLHNNGWQLITLTRESCPPTKGYTQWSPADITLTESCRTFNHSALRYIIARPDIRTVVLVGRWRAGLVPDVYRGDPSQQSADQNADNLKLGLSSEVAALEAAGRHVIIVEDTPEFPDDPVAGVRSRYLPWRRMLNRFFRSDPPDEGDGSSIERFVAVSREENHANDQVLAVGTAHPNAALVNPKQVLCDSSRCFFANDVDLFFFDSIHLSRTGAIRILPLLPPLDALR